MEERRLTIFSLGDSILASVMVACVVTTVSRAIGVFETAWMLDLLAIQRELAVAAFLVAMEVQLTRRLLEQHTVLGRAWLAAIAAEWGFWLVGLLAAVWIARGPRFTLQEIPMLGAMTAQVLMRPEFREMLVLLVAVWGISRYLAVDLIAMENLPVGLSKESMRGLMEEQNTARTRLWQDVFVLGGVMVFLSVFSVPIAHFVWGMPMDFGSLGLEILVFFLCGLGLFVIGRLMILRAEWVTERTSIDPNVTRHWIGYGLVFVLVLLLAAVVLPTEYTFQLLASLKLVILGISTFMALVWTIIMYSIVWLLSFLMPPVGEKSQVTKIPPVEDLYSKNLPALPPGISWETIIREFLFWGVVAFILVSVIRQLLPLRFSALRRLRHWPVFRFLMDILRRLRKRWLVWKQSVAQTVRESWQALREDLAGRGGWDRTGFLNLRRLNPRQSIRFYFFALLRRGAERGVVRRPAQTPREYSADLSNEESLIREELQEITLAFEEARYTSHPLGPSHARRVRLLWDTIRAALRSTKSAGGNGERLRK